MHKITVTFEFDNTDGRHFINSAIQHCGESTISELWWAASVLYGEALECVAKCELERGMQPSEIYSQIFKSVNIDKEDQLEIIRKRLAQ